MQISYIGDYSAFSVSTATIAYIKEQSKSDTRSIFSQGTMFNSYIFFPYFLTSFTING